MNERQRYALLLPPDPWWLLRVQVPNDGDCVPYQLMLLWHYQWRTPQGLDA